MILAPLPVQRFYDNNNNPANKGQLFVYQAGTTTKQTSYQDQAGTPNTNPVILNFRGECNLWLDTLLTYKFVFAPADDTDPPTRPFWTVDNVSGGYGGLIDWTKVYYDQTPAELAATVTPVNYYYPPGYWDRYATNSIPGTTDMSAAASAAYAVAKQTGCSVRFGATAPYRLNSPVNCTQMRGIVTWDESSKNASAGVPSIIIAHDGATSSHGFDLSASTEMVFNNMVPTNLAGKVPNCVFFCARNGAGSGAGVHRFNNIRTPSNATFKFFYYGYGSEENNYQDCFIYNTQAGSGVFSHNATNPSGYTSNFITIATGAQSNAGHHHWGGSYFQFGNSGSANEVVFQNENCADFSFEAGLWFCNHGLAFANFNGNAGSQGIIFRGIRGEPDGSTRATYGILVNNSAGSHANWTIDNCQADANQELLYIDDNTSINRLNLVNSTSIFSGKVFNAKNASNMTINHGTGIVTGRAAGTISSSTFIGSRSQVTFNGTDSLNTGYDQALGEHWETNDRYTSPSVACTGAITTASSYKLVKSAQGIVLTLPVISGTASAVTSFTFGTALPTIYRPAADIWCDCSINNNGATVNQPGFVLVSASTGNISVFRDKIGTAYTAATAAGLPGAVSISWRL